MDNQFGQRIRFQRAKILQDHLVQSEIVDMTLNLLVYVIFYVVKCTYYEKAVATIAISLL